MKQILTILLIALALTSYSQIYSSQKKLLGYDSIFDESNKKNSSSIGKPFPEFHINSNKAEFSNSCLKGKVVFINFWFSACAPCIAELEELNKLYKDFKNDKNFEFISFTFDDSLTIESMKKQYNIQYKVLSIPRTECYRLNLNNGFPTSAIVDKAGMLKYIHTGGEANDKEIKKFFKDHYYPLISAAL